MLNWVLFLMDIGLNQINKLIQTHLIHYFQREKIFVSGQFTTSESRKPFPYMINTYLDTFSYQPKECVFYGNIMNDIIAGRLAGVTTILLATDYQQNILSVSQPHIHIENWNQIIEHM